MNNNEFPDFRRILERIANGDERAFAILYDFFAEDLIRHILSKVANKQVAEDILHDLFLTLWRNRLRLTDIESLPAYLYSSCRYLILAYYRKQLKEGNSIDLHELDILDDSVSLEDRIHYRYVIDIVSNEIENLPVKCREIFKLSRSEYLSNREIAERMNISVSTVEKHINKAISRLRNATKRNLFFF
ncbi:RNA polymerase sigma factor [Sphingobacterium rhinopitheci]|uniref:RNA polymerase sigma factor n=1 Tax=Sphingobacterium rhinopitheci TaxID=2781960 RepID=UPI001F51ECFE|nr:RNA polymerase sigma-70 factor [Sphingobacterium rhinopitheci]MCI0921908.1 RNA polymerase sigma-70 factor [Sphingobacterium rhinopitheci]